MRIRTPQVRYGGGPSGGTDTTEEYPGPFGEDKKLLNTLRDGSTGEVRVSGAPVLVQTQGAPGGVDRTTCVPGRNSPVAPVGVSTGLGTGQVKV